MSTKCFFFHDSKICLSRDSKTTQTKIEKRRMKLQGKKTKITDNKYKESMRERETTPAKLVGKEGVEMDMYIYTHVEISKLRCS